MMPWLRHMLRPWRTISTSDKTCSAYLWLENLIKIGLLVSKHKILCDCEAIAYLRFRHLGQFFMEPSDFYDAPIIEVLHFIRSAGLIER
jgi:hypothetical protein